MLKVKGGELLVGKCIALLRYVDDTGTALLVTLGTQVRHKELGFTGQVVSWTGCTLGVQDTDGAIHFGDVSAWERSDT